MDDGDQHQADVLSLQEVRTRNREQDRKKEKANTLYLYGYMESFTLPGF